MYWFDQPSEPSSHRDLAWAFSVSEKPKAKMNERKPRGPPGLAPPVLTSISNKYKHLTPDDENDSDGDEAMADKGKHRAFTIGDPISIAKKKKVKQSDDELMESLIKVNRLHADRGAASEPERTVERRAKVRFCRDFATAVPCTCDDCPSTSTQRMPKTTASPVNMLQSVPPKEESVNMVSGNWRREE